MKDFEKIAALGSLLSKKYASELFMLLKDYKSISASEAASRLDLHIQTVQEFLETTSSLGITEREEVFERKRPYFRYTIIHPDLNLRFSLSEILDEEPSNHVENTLRIREKKNSKSHFSLARSGDHFSSVSILTGSGRESQQRKINLTMAQGKFLFHLPFPDAQPLSIEKIMENAGVEEEYRSEIENLINELEELKIIENAS